MESKNSRISAFLSKNGHETNFELSPLDGLTNKVYKVSTGKQSFIYREYGCLKQFTGVENERIVSKIFYNYGISPKMLLEEETYRIEEFLENVEPIPQSEIFSSDVVSFIIECEKKLINSVSQEEFSKASSIFDLIENKFYNPACEKLSHILENTPPFVCSYFKPIKTHFDRLDDFSELKKAKQVMQHNDLHSLNILRNSEGKRFLIDLEYASIAPIGSDIANLIIESCFDYTDLANPNAFTAKTLEEMYNQYQNMVVLLDSDPEISTIAYFKQLIDFKNTFWLFYCVLIFEMDQVENGDFFLLNHASQRLALINN